MGASETKHAKISDEVASPTSNIGKTLTVLSSMQVPKSGQGVVNHGLKRVYFEKKYLVVGVIYFNTTHDVDNLCKKGLLRRLNIQVNHESQEHQRLIVLCDKTLDMKKLPDPDYVVCVDPFKFISTKSMKTCLSKSHCSLV